MTRERIPAPEPGLYADTPAEEYHSWDAISNSTLGHMLRSPAHCKYAMENPEETTESLKIGSAFHMLVLEPERFRKYYVIHPKYDRRTKEGKAAWEKLTSQVSEDRLLTEDIFEQITAMRDAIMAKSEARKLVEGVSHAELSGVWYDRLTGVKCKMRADAIVNGVLVLDLKTTDNASFLAFQRKIFDFGYHRQGAMYIGGLRELEVDINHYALMVVEKEPPYGVAIYRLKDEAIGAGQAQLEDLLKKVECCQKTNLWPDYDNAIQDIGIPEWAMKQIEKGF